MFGNITDVPGVKVGQVSDLAALTGCTVILTEAGAVGGVDVRGAAPGTRETDLLQAGRLVDKVHGIVLSGGSAFGLDAAGGVMRYLEERGCGFDAGAAKVPIVPAAVLFDLHVGDSSRRPDAAMGYAACAAARTGPLEEGNAGAGTGATVSKYRGMANCMKGGIGSWSSSLAGGLIVGAIVAVNAFGDAVEWRNGTYLTGVRDPAAGGLLRTADLLRSEGGGAGFQAGNTTLAVVATNAALTKAEVNKVAQMAHNGLALALRPVHTMFDGDTVFALSCGTAAGDVNTVGTVAVEVVAEAIKRAVLAAASVEGIPASRDVVK